MYLYSKYCLPFLVPPHRVLNPILPPLHLGEDALLECPLLGTLSFYRIRLILSTLRAFRGLGPALNALSVVA